MLFPVIVKKLKTMEVSILIIRQERPEDYDTVYHVVKEAFENAEYQAWQTRQRMQLGSAWGDSPYVFTTLEGQTMRPDTLTNWFHSFIQRTDLPPIHLHSLRHTNATLQIANGVPLTTVAGNLGHADSATTTKIYAHAIQSAAAASAQMMDDLLNPMADKRRP